VIFTIEANGTGFAVLKPFSALNGGTNSVKDVHLHDLAFQAWLLTQAGLRIRNVALLHINPDFVRKGPVDPHNLFKLVDMTSQVRDLFTGVEDRLSYLLKTIRQPQYPDIKIGPHYDPYTRPLHDHCWSFLPEQSVLDLYRGTKKGFELLDQGVTLLKDIPANTKLTQNQAIQKQVAVTGQPHIRKGAISEFLKRLGYPIHFLDFETFGTATPLFDRLRPYQPVPFQFSLHVLRAPGTEPEQEMFLADGRGDPRPAFMFRLREAIGREGSIVAFNAEFEKGRLRECCEVLPNFVPWLARIKGRFVDLLEPFRSFDYYHPQQGGSASMKAVLPAQSGDDRFVSAEPATAIQCPPITVYPVRRRSLAKSCSICAAASNGIGFRWAYSSGNRRIAVALHYRRRLVPLLVIGEPLFWREP
jgi:hypothetical protein